MFTIVIYIISKIICNQLTEMTQKKKVKDIDIEFNRSKTI